MKKALLIIILFLFRDAIFCVSARAQDCNADFLGTKTLYKSGTRKYIPVPAGYLPVFINHVGRHGARHLTKDVNTTLAYALLLRADSVNALTEKGKLLKQMVLALQRVEKGGTKSISEEGKAELKGIGERMYARYPGVFKGKPKLNVGITKEVRTKQSADAFLTGLNAKLPEPATTNEYNDDTHLRFYDASPAYKSFEDGVDGSELTLALEKANHFDELNKAFTGRFFNPDALNKLSGKDQGKFTSDIFGFATIVYSLTTEVKQAGFKSADVDFKSFFTCDELTTLGLLDSVDEDLKKGPGTDNNGIQVRVAVPLLVDFINTADDFVKGGKYNAQLRFAHAETISPFATLLQISDADKATTDMNKIAAAWKSSEIIPLSSNIQWIFYKKKGAAGYMVKILLNEKEAHINGLSKATFYYKWSDVRALYINKLIKLNVKLEDDMAAYLVSLK